MKYDVSIEEVQAESAVTTRMNLKSLKDNILRFQNIGVV